MDLYCIRSSTVACVSAFGVPYGFLVCRLLVFFFENAVFKVPKGTVAKVKVEPHLKVWYNPVEAVTEMTPDVVVVP